MQYVGSAVAAEAGIALRGGFVSALARRCYAVEILCGYAVRRDGFWDATWCLIPSARVAVSQKLLRNTLAQVSDMDAGVRILGATYPVLFG